MVGIAILLSMMIFLSPVIARKMTGNTDIQGISNQAFIMASFSYFFVALFIILYSTIKAIGI